MTDSVKRRYVSSYVKRAIGYIAQEYPTWNGQYLEQREDLSTPRERHPLFWGCYDWHSSVHTHWALAESYSMVDDELKIAIEEALSASFNDKDVALEARVWDKMDDADFFERPYGMAWFLELVAQLRRNCAKFPESAVWPSLASRLSELEAIIAQRLLNWVDSLDIPSRSGKHDQTAWSLMLFHDWARVVGSSAVAGAIERKAKRFYIDDYDAPYRYEPDCHAFFSPVLNEAMLMGKILEPNRYLEWLERFLPGLFNRDWAGIPPVSLSGNDADYLIAHHYGLGLTRAVAWRAIGAAARESEVVRRKAQLFAAAEANNALQSCEDAPYSIAHWVGSYAIAWLAGSFS